MTTTIEDAFGSRLMTRGGFLLNNELTDFSLSPVQDGKPVANRVEARKRPRSSMAPTIVYDAKGQVLMICGSPGGSAIINYVAKTLVGVLDWNLDPQAAIDLPNIGSRNGPTELEKDTSAAELEPKLKALGHDTRVMEQTSGLQAIVRTRDGWIGGADPRREGAVAGDLTLEDMMAETQARHKVVIVGGGAGGLPLATRLGDKLGRRGGAEITLIDRYATHLWKPLLHEVAAGRMDADVHAVDDPALAHCHRFVFRQGSIAGLDRARHALELDEVYDDDGALMLPKRTVHYVTMVFCVGSISNDFGMSGVSTHYI